MLCVVLPYRVFGFVRSLCVYRLSNKVQDDATGDVDEALGVGACKRTLVSSKEYTV